MAEMPFRSSDCSLDPRIASTSCPFEVAPSRTSNFPDSYFSCLPVQDNNSTQVAGLDFANSSLPASGISAQADFACLSVPSSNSETSCSSSLIPSLLRSPSLDDPIHCSSSSPTLPLAKVMTPANSAINSDGWHSMHDHDLAISNIAPTSISSPLAWSVSERQLQPWLQHSDSASLMPILRVCVDCQATITPVNELINAKEPTSAVLLKYAPHSDGKLLCSLPGQSNSTPTSPHSLSQVCCTRFLQPVLSQPASSI
ncbi:unnamed protein product [Protopolystoma xenopodis]|uniref:Uncharacterized protein n=1 Tax=Protopolystoma xenopodis TaxID=117903 RepID=A0A3S5B375_9PLAT|nr:unnamed protein product [Protopolystoma xenopodis]